MKIKKYIRFIQEARHRTSNNLSIVPMLFKLLHWMLKNRGRLAIFFYLDLHTKHRKISDYMTEPEYLRIYRKIYPPFYAILLEDKYVFDRFLMSFNFPLAELEGLIQNKQIHWLKDGITEPVANIINRDLNCYLKMHINWGGNQVYKLDIKDGSMSINNKISSIQDLQKIIDNDIFVLQKTLIQHPEMNRLNPSCINTLRIATIKGKGKIDVFERVIRIGIRGSVVDNLSQGNLISGLNDDGSIFETASTHHIDLSWVTHHPDTNVEFKSFKVPYFKEAINLTKKLHEVFHCFLLIAWDIAITENGPVVIEGNPFGDIFWPQIFMGCKKKELQSYMSEYKPLKRF